MYYLSVCWDISFLLNFQWSNNMIQSCLHLSSFYLLYLLFMWLAFSSHTPSLSPPHTLTIFLHHYYFTRLVSINGKWMIVCLLKPLAPSSVVFALFSQLIYHYYFLLFLSTNYNLFTFSFCLLSFFFFLSPLPDLFSFAVTFFFSLS